MDPVEQAEKKRIVIDVEFNGIEHYDIFEGDVITFWVDISNPPKPIQVMAQRIDGSDYEPGRFGVCINYSFKEKDFYVVTDMGMTPEIHRNIFYIDQAGDKHWFEADVPQTLLEQIVEECKKIVESTFK